MPNTTPLPTGALTTLAELTGIHRSILSRAFHGHGHLRDAHITSITRRFQLADPDMLAGMNHCCLIAYCCSMLCHSNYLLHDLHMVRQSLTSH